MRVAVFISPHGLGHAARECALLEELGRVVPEVQIDLITTAPQWFFEESLTHPFTRRPVEVDLGLVQSNSLDEDLPGTVRRLEQMLPFDDALLDDLAEHVSSADLVMCDVAPLGIAAAKRAGVRSMLIENFTWDWIYRGYEELCPEILPFADRFEEIFDAADVRLQTEPVCRPVDGSLTAPPVGRRPRAGRAATRERLGVPEGEPLVLVTMGGIEWDYDELAEQIGGFAGGMPWILAPGGGRSERRGRLIRLPHQSDFYHPDLIAASDAVLGKLGYSTLAEVAAAGVPYGYVARDRFRESPALGAWIEENLSGLRIESERFTSGAWLEDAKRLVEMPRRPLERASRGATIAAEHVAAQSSWA